MRRIFGKETVFSIWQAIVEAGIVKGHRVKKTPSRKTKIKILLRFSYGKQSLKACCLYNGPFCCYEDMGLRINREIFFNNQVIAQIYRRL